MTFNSDRPARHSLIQLCCAALACAAPLIAAKADEPPIDLSEREFLTDIPLVYSASRLPQQPQDAAGATSVIDREMIRASGARDITDLFRLVPGFQVGSSSGGRPVVSYHGLSGQISQRMQVYVDGRSLYAPYLFGGVDWTALSVPLDEIERIEIQRGANSVTYGANAFLGVIHIITRAAAQSVGWYTQITQGNSGIADRHIRWGHSTPSAQWRVSAGTKSDDGLTNRLDAYNTKYLDLRAEMQPSLTSELSLFAGMTQSQLGIGYDASTADPARNEKIESSFFHARYKKVIDSGQEWSIAFSSTKDAGNDSFSIPLLNADSILVDNNRLAQRYALSYQHFKDLSQQLRASWGLEYNTDELVARQLFSTDQPQTNEAWRAYLNQEWKPSPSWTLNLGGLVERNGLAPTQFAPRVSLNWKFSPENTLKLGYSSAFRTPSLFEQRANWRTEYQGSTLNIRYLSRGGLVPEQVKALDLVYFGQWQKPGLTLDARLFREEISQLITGELYLLPSDQANTSNAVAYDLRNNASVTNTGFEYQLSWRPKLGSMLVWSQHFSNPQSPNSFVQSSIPRTSSSLLLSHTWKDGVTSGLSYTETAPMLWLGESTIADRQRLVSLRLARSMRVNDTTMQISAVWRQPLGQAYEFRELQSNPKQFWINLRIEY
jgi:iron complex outermembrane receptor protein